MEAMAFKIASINENHQRQLVAPPQQTPMCSCNVLDLVTHRNVPLHLSFSQWYRTPARRLPMDQFATECWDPQHSGRRRFNLSRAVPNLLLPSMRRASRLFACSRSEPRPPSSSTPGASRHVHLLPNPGEHHIGRARCPKQVDHSIGSVPYKHKSLAVS
ncbi:hypothetical protein BDZ85DRAFT_34266 [Elsinoe ampelina]|uniref:Uncharacterized protein n=1 Tax=Elsinoe ampelina TaxID=302913 RepID=A0A6A6G3N1_9PEZI|nr:hypothetical protein BDZ85DRAFT_34266 [Elsinoe ampelina]